MNAAPPTERLPPVVAVLPTPEILCADGAELRPTRLLTIRTATKAGDVTGLYLLLDCGPRYARLVKVGPKPDTYILTLREGRAVACTCADWTMRPERRTPDGCKHCRAFNLLAQEK